MKQSILVTAVSGSDKTTTCQALQKLGYAAYDIESLPGLFAWHDDATGAFIPDYQDDVRVAKTASWICDRAKLQQFIAAEPAELTFYCGAASNMDDIWDLFDRVIILQVSDQTSEQRLSSRPADAYGHTPEVREYIFSWKANLEQDWLSKGAIPVSAEQDPETVAKLVVGAAG